MEVTRRQGRRRKKLLDDLKDTRGYSYLKEEALDRNMWRVRFGRGFEPVVRQTTGWWWWWWWWWWWCRKKKELNPVNSEYGKELQPSKKDQQFIPKGLRITVWKIQFHSDVGVFARTVQWQTDMCWSTDRKDDLFFLTTWRLALRPSSILFSGYTGRKVAGSVKLSDHSAPFREEFQNVLFLIPTPACIFKLGKLFPA